MVRLAKDGAMFTIAQFEKQIQVRFGAAAKSSELLASGRN
jgi:hypothetical protein